MLMMAGVLLIVLTGFVVAQQGIHESGQGLEDGEIAGSRVRVVAGNYVGEGGQQIRVNMMENNQCRLEVGGVGADCPFNLTQEQFENRTRLNMALSNGRNAEVKVMPNVASETALQRLRLKDCSGNCSIELKEVGAGENARAAYEVKTQRSSRVFGIFRVRMNVQAQVDAETGEVIRTNKPWWAFLASEPEE